MKKRNLSLVTSLFITIIFSGQLLAQGIKVSGKVTDAADGSPLVGVTIQEKGTNNGTVTDINGDFTITVAQSAFLVVSYVGYTTQEVPVNNRTTVNIALAVGELALQEVVVIGYGTVARRDATGSVAAVSSRDFTIGSVSSPQELIVGKVPGVQITTSGGDPTAASRIRIRGGSSMSASNDPLIVIDGVPIDNNETSGMPNPLSLLNSNDIESFTVLKDASATAIYGSRASNGVILITTKKGALDKPLTVTYAGSVSLGNRTGDISVLSPSEFREEVLRLYPEPSAAASLLGQATTNWQNQVYQTAVSHDHNLALSGKAGILPYRASVGYTNQKGLLLTSGLERVTGSLNLNPSFFDRHLTVTVNSKYMNIRNRFADWGAVGSAMAFDPTQPVYDDTSVYGGYFYWRQNSGAPITIATSNPVSQLHERNNTSDVNRFLGNIQLEYLLHFIPNLKATLNLGGDFSGSKGTNVVGESVAWSYDPENGGGENNYYTQKKRNELLDFYLNYNKDLAAINSRIDATAGYSWQHFFREDSISNSNFSGRRIDERNLNITENYLVSFFGRINYILANKYLLTATLRNDGSSRFSRDNRWGLFPAFALAWEINRENFLQPVNVINTLKLRIGYGITGQQELGTDYPNDYPYLARYTFSQANAQYQFGDEFVTTLRPEGYDVNLKWEETSTFNIGLDFGFLDERITGSIDAYHRTTRDMLNTIPVPAGTNLTNQILTNVGDMVNRGFEFALTLRPVVTPTVEWSMTFNGTINQNEITRLTAVDDPAYIGVVAGLISGGVGNYIQIHTVGYPLNSFYVYEQVYNSEGRPIEGLYVDKNGDGNFTVLDKYRAHSPAPDFFLGLSTSLNFGKFDFGFNGRLNAGNYVYNNMSSNYGSYSELYRSVGYLANLNRSILDTGFDNPQYWSDYYLENATFFRMDNMYLGYSFNPLFSERGSLRVYLNAQNLFTITGYSGLDPEVQDGIDNNIFPRPRTFMLGVNFQF